ncbi:MAG: hypothetical protein QOF31_2444 [Mycobacterium sp.]|nr:hypothetical protein [Mycobacterium sp.]
MLPSRTTLKGWNPDSLAASSEAISSGAATVSGAVTGIDSACQRMPETKAWSGRSHEAAAEMFGRAGRDASRFSEYANAVASALKNGSGMIGSARGALLNKADQVDQGELNVTDQWVVLIDPVRMPTEKLAQLQALAQEEQATINSMLTAVGNADDETANAVVAAGGRFGFVEAGPMTSDPSSMMLPSRQRPGDQVPDPRTPVGMIGQEAIRAGDESISIREVTESKNQYGEEVTTVVMQDGSKQVITRNDPFEWPDRQNFITVEQSDKHGNEVSRSSSWHDLGNDCDYTSVTWPDGSNFTMSMDPTGYRNAGFTTASGRHSAVPVELIDDISNSSGAALSGLEKHIVHGGSLPMLTAESVENVGKAAKFGGPALGVATTVFDMVMADTGRDACIASIAGAAGAGGGWGGAEFGAYAGTFFGPGAPIAIPALAFLIGVGGAFGGADLGKFVGNVVCPY